MKDIVDMYKYEKEEIYAINLYMQEHIDSCQKESEKRAAYLEQNIENFEDVASITVNSVSAIRQEKQNWSE